MLFDLRGRGRRNTVRVIYVGLALLIGVGLIGFGIGGGFGGGGILNAASNNEGSSAASFAKQVEKARKAVAKDPSNPEAWQKLTEAQVHEAGNEENHTTTGLTADGQRAYKATSESWSHYLSLKPSKPSLKLAKQVLLLYGAEGLNEPAKAVEVLEIIVGQIPETKENESKLASYYGSLAAYAYEAHNERLGDLSTEKALRLTAKAQRASVKKELEAIKKAESKASTEATSTTSTSTTATTSESSKTSTSSSSSAESSKSAAGSSKKK